MPEFELTDKKQLEVCKDSGIFYGCKAPISGLSLIPNESCCYGHLAPELLAEFAGNAKVTKSVAVKSYVVA